MGKNHGVGAAGKASGPSHARSAGGPRSGTSAAERRYADLGAATPEARAALGRIRGGRATSLREFRRDPEAAIRSAYDKALGGKAGGRVYLADIREKLPAVPRRTLDRALLKLATSGKASLYQLDNPIEARQPRNQRGKLLTPSGSERHIIYMDRRG